MKDLVVEYKLLGLIPFRWKRNIPERWDEVTPKQLITLSLLYMEEINDIQTVASFYSIPKTIVRWMPEYYVFTLITELDFISDFQPCHRFMIKSLSGLEPPRPRLEGMSFGQFIFADTYFDDYAAEVNPDSLHKFIASLYTPKGKKFDDKKIPAIADRVKRQDQAELQAIVINYRLVREWLMEAYPVLFSKAKNSKGKDSGSRSQKGWLDVLDSLVDDDIVNFDKYAQMPLHNVLRYMSKKIKQNAKRPKV